MSRKKEDNRDVFEKALDYGPEALMAAGAVGAAGALGARAMRAARNRQRMKKADGMSLQPTEAKALSVTTSRSPRISAPETRAVSDAEARNLSTVGRRRK